MAGEKLSLEILIKTIADAQGIRATEDGIKQVAKEFESAAEAGKPLEITAETIKQKLTDVGAAAKGAKPAVDGLGDSTKKVGDAQKNAARNVNELGENFEKGAAAGRVLSSAMQGNVSAIFQLAPAIKALGALMKTNLIGVLITLGALAAQFIVPLVKGFNDAKKSIEDTTKEAEALAKVKMDTLTRELNVAGEAADVARTKFAEAQAAAERLDNAEQAAQLAEVRANPKLNDQQKAAAESQVRQSFRTRGQARALDSKEFAASGAVEAESAARSATARPDQDLKAAIQKLDQLYDLERQRLAAQDRLAALQQRYNEQLLQNQRGQGKLGDTQATASQIAEVARSLAGPLKDRRPEIEAAKERVSAALVPANAAQVELAKRERASTAAAAAVERERNLQTQENELFAREQGAQFSTETDTYAKEIGLGTKKIADVLTQSADQVEKANAVRGKQGGTLQKEGGTVVQATPLSKAATITNAAGDVVDIAKTSANSPIRATQTLPTATPAGVEQVQTQNNAALAGVAEAIAAVETPEPLNATELLQNFLGYHQVNVAKHQQSAAALAAQARQIADLGRQLAAVEITARNSREGAV